MQLLNTQMSCMQRSFTKHMDLTLLVYVILMYLEERQDPNGAYAHGGNSKICKPTD